MSRRRSAESRQQRQLPLPRRPRGFWESQEGLQLLWNSKLKEEGLGVVKGAAEDLNEQRRLGEKRHQLPRDRRGIKTRP